MLTEQLREKAFRFSARCEKRERKEKGKVIIIFPQTFPIRHKASQFIGFYDPSLSFFPIFRASTSDEEQQQRIMSIWAEKLL